MSLQLSLVEGVYIGVLSSSQRGRYKITNPQLSKENFKEKEKLVMGPDGGGLTPGQTGRLTVGQKATLTLTWSDKLKSSTQVRSEVTSVL
jgi:hypothetical protein